MSFGKLYTSINEIVKDQKNTIIALKKQWRQSPQPFNWFIKPYFHVSVELLTEEPFYARQLDTGSVLLTTDGFMVIHPLTDQIIKCKIPEQITVDLYYDGHSTKGAYVCNKEKQKIRKLCVRNQKNAVEGIYRYYYSNHSLRMGKRRIDKENTNSLVHVEQLLYLATRRIRPYHILSGEIETPF